MSRQLSATQEEGSHQMPTGQYLLTWLELPALWELNVCCLIHCSLWYFVIAAWAKAIGKSAIFFQNWLRKKVIKHNTGHLSEPHALNTDHSVNEGVMELCSTWTSKKPRLTELLHLEMYHLKQAILHSHDCKGRDLWRLVQLRLNTLCHLPQSPHNSSQWPQSLARGLGRWKMREYSMSDKGLLAIPSRLYRLVWSIYSLNSFCSAHL